MRFTILAAIVPLLSLTVAQGNWNCKNSDDPEYMKMDLQHRQASPNGLCVNDGGLGLLAHRCTAGKPCKQNNNGCIPINDFEANCSS